MPYLLEAFVADMSRDDKNNNNNDDNDDSKHKTTTTTLQITYCKLYV